MTQITQDRERRKRMGKEQKKEIKREKVKKWNGR